MPILSDLLSSLSHRNAGGVARLTDSLTRVTGPGASLEKARGRAYRCSSRLPPRVLPLPTTPCSDPLQLDPWLGPGKMWPPMGQVQLGFEVPLCAPTQAPDASYPASPATGATAVAAATRGGRGLYSPGAVARPWRIVPRSDPPGRKTEVSWRCRAQFHYQPAARSIRFRFCFSSGGCREVLSGDRSVTQHPHPYFRRSPGGPQ